MYSKRQTLGNLLKSLVLAGMLVLAMSVVPGFLLAATTAPATTDQDQAQTQHFDTLLRTIEDDAKRAEFIDNLKALIAARKAQQADTPTKTSLLAVSFISGRIDRLSREVLDAADALLRLPQLVARFSTKLTDQEMLDAWLRVLGMLLLTLACAWLLDRLARRLLKRMRTELESRTVEAMGIRLLSLLGRTVLEVIPILVFGVSAHFVLSLIDPGLEAHAVTLALVDAIVVYRALIALARMLFAPAAAQLRLLPLADISANYWFIWSRRLVSVAVYGYFFTAALLFLGMPNGPNALIAKLLGLVLTGMLVVLVLQNRAGVANWLLRPSANAPEAEPEDAVQFRQPVLATRRGLQLLRKRLAETWHVLVILYVVAIFVVWALGIPGGFAYLLRASVVSLVIVSFTSLLSTGLRRAIDRRFAIPERLHLRFPLLEARANRYLPMLKLMVNASIWLIAGLSLLQTWGVGVLGWLNSTAGHQLLTSAITIIFIALAALLAWEVVSYLIERAIERARVLDDANQNARIMTLLPLARRTFLLVLVVLVVLMVLSEFGLNIAPLLAGAGVIGLAIGFGAQTLVKDVITGLFILIENTITVGDYIDVGGHEGTVESLTIRSVRLRDAAANVHTVPFSVVSSVLNYTRDYSYAVLNIGIAYRENIDEVIAVIEALGEQMLADKEVAENILEPIQVQGVNALDDSAVVIRARIKVKAGNQWAMRRYFNRIMKNRFDELGIEIPFPHQTVYFGVDASGQAPPAQVVLRRGSEAPVQSVAPKPRHKPVSRSSDDSSSARHRVTDHDVDQGGGVD